MRLIDADKLIEDAELRYVKMGARGGGKSILTLAKTWLLNEVESAPAIEAKPVFHAHWEKGCDDEYIAIPWWTCSHCGKGALTKKETIYDQVLTDYCPYCGAQMDEVIV